MTGIAEGGVVDVEFTEVAKLEFYCGLSVFPEFRESKTYVCSDGKRVVDFDVGASGVEVFHCETCAESEVDAGFEFACLGGGGCQREDDGSDGNYALFHGVSLRRLLFWSWCNGAGLPFPSPLVLPIVPVFIVVDFTLQCGIFCVKVVGQYRWMIWRHCGVMSCTSWRDAIVGRGWVKIVVENTSAEIV